MKSVDKMSFILPFQFVSTLKDQAPMSGTDPIIMKESQMPVDKLLEYLS